MGLHYRSLSKMVCHRYELIAEDCEGRSAKVVDYHFCSEGLDIMLADDAGRRAGCVHGDRCRDSADSTAI